jgi:hypothetical protein
VAAAVDDKKDVVGGDEHLAAQLAGRVGAISELAPSKLGG